jgi:hypothetical protein
MSRRRAESRDAQGQRRFSFQDGDFIIGRLFGEYMHPAWYLNLEHRPEAEVTVKGSSGEFLHEKFPPKRKILSGRGWLSYTSVHFLSTTNESGNTACEAV